MLSPITGFWGDRNRITIESPLRSRGERSAEFFGGSFMADEANIVVLDDSLPSSRFLRRFYPRGDLPWRTALPACRYPCVWLPSSGLRPVPDFPAAVSPLVGAGRFCLRQRFSCTARKPTCAGNPRPRKPTSLEHRGQAGGLSYLKINLPAMIRTASPVPQV